jgi:DNA-binding response OmpR family regulator
MHAPRVLVVDDDLSLCQVYCRFLTRQGYDPLATPSAAGAVALVRTFCPGLALVDIAMRNVSGIRLLQILRAAPETARLPVILMTGLSVPEEMVTITANSLGAGKIFIKGGDLFTLERRIQTALTAGVLQAPPARSCCLRRGNLTADPDSHKAWFGNREIPLRGRRAFDLLQTLLRSPQPQDRRTLHRLIWGDGDNVGVVEVSMRRLRRDLQEFPGIHIDATPTGYLLIA